MKRKHFDIALHIKSLSEDGTFEGYGSVFGVKDSYGEIVMPGAFSKSLSKHRSAGTMPAMLWQHDSDDVCGVWLEMIEDGIGLKVNGKLAIKTAYGSDAYELLKINAIRGLSIGYITEEEEIDRVAGVTKLIKLDLWEISLVTFPANTSATVTNVKSIEAIVDLKSAEAYLRDVGMSRKESVAFVSRIKALPLSDSGDGEMKQLLDALKRREAAIPL